nr:hypothetical protein [Tanacetum cinerariifolium]
MSTQQDIYAAGSESRPPMLNKENYVPWSSRLLWYAKSRPNGKLIHNSIRNGPYVRRMIPELGDANREVNVTETFHLQTDDELSDKELKQIEADDQAIQTILLGLPEDIYAAVDSCETAQEIWLRVQQTMKGFDIGIQEKKAKLFTEWERFTSNEGESIESYYHRFLKLMNDLKRNKHFPEKIASNLKFLNNLQPEWSNGRNQFRQYARQNTGNPAGYNDVIGNQVISNAVQNPRVQNVGNQNGLIGVQGNGNQNQIGNGNLVAARAEGNAAGQNENQIRCYNCKGEAAKFVGDFKSLAKEADDSLAKHKALELEIERLLKAVVSQDIMIILGDLKGKSKDTSCVSDTRNPLSQKHEKENVELEFQVLNYARENAHLKATYKNLFDSIYVSCAQTKTIIASLQNELQSNIYKNAKLRTQLFKKVSDQKDNTKNSSENTKFARQPIVENLPKVGKTNALSNPVNSNSDSTPQESKSVNNDKVIAPGLFRINHSKTSREEKQVPNTIRASARTKPITISQPHVITKKDVNSDLNGLSST